MANEGSINDDDDNTSMMGGRSRAKNQEDIYQIINIGHLSHIALNSYTFFFLSSLSYSS